MLILALLVIGIPMALMTSFVLPIWAFVDAIRDTEMKRGERVLWRLFCIVFWGLGSAIYGIARSRSPRLRKASLWTLIGVGLFALIIIIMCVVKPHQKLF